MGLFSKKPKDIILQWSPESDSTWEKQKKETRFKPMKGIRCGGVSLMIVSLDRAADGMLVTNVSVSNYDEKAIGFNSGGFGLVQNDKQYRCSKLKVQLGKADFLHPETLEGKEVGFRDAAVGQFQQATFMAYFDAPTPDEAFAIVVEAKRISAPNIIFVTPYERSELAVWGLAR
jgi:hypothetical protein